MCAQPFWNACNSSSHKPQDFHVGFKHLYDAVDCDAADGDAGDDRHGDKTDADFTLKRYGNTADYAAMIKDVVRRFPSTKVFWK